MSAAFTPGPWAEDGDLIYSPAKGRRVGKIATVSLGYKDSATYSANASLIAAAPELYEALETCRAALDPYIVHNVGAGTAREVADAALAKARGEQ